MSVILRNRWAMLIVTTAAVAAIVGYLVVTLGVFSGAKVASGSASISAGNTSANLSAEPSATVTAATDPAVTAGPTPSATSSASATRKAVKPAVTAAKTPKTSAAATAKRTGTSRRVTFVNRTTQKIWVAGWQQTAKPALTRSGWVLAAGKSLTITVADKWNGRFWGRTGCTFNAAGKGHCVTGDCAGVFQCKGYGGIPASLAEFNFNAWQHLDFYDVSLVDGSNLPMWINHTGGSTKDAISTKGCVAAGCTKAVPCPKKLVVDGGAGCESPCAKLGGDQYCCAGKWAPRSECDPTKWPVDYAAIFKKAEPFAYSYVDDDATSTFTCKGRCDYKITFGLSPS